MIDQSLRISSKEIQRKIIEENTHYYLQMHLNPQRNWDVGITPKQRIEQIVYANVDWKVVSAFIRGMEYQNFLKTPYWQAIAAYVKYKAGHRCRLCNSPHDLVTHHRNYRVHGYEHAHMEELTVLCDGCHSKFHNQMSKSRFKAKLALTIFIIKLMIVSAFFGHYLNET